MAINSELANTSGEGRSLDPLRGPDIQLDTPDLAGAFVETVSAIADEQVILAQRVYRKRLRENFSFFRDDLTPQTGVTIGTKAAGFYREGGRQALIAFTLRYAFFSAVTVPAVFLFGGGAPVALCVAVAIVPLSLILTVY